MPTLTAIKSVAKCKTIALITDNNAELNNETELVQSSRLRQSTHLRLVHGHNVYLLTQRARCPWNVNLTKLIDC